MPAVGVVTVCSNPSVPGCWATVTGIHTPASGADRDLVLRLVELGFVPGARVRIVAEGLGRRDPLAVRVGHTTFALRRYEASFILVQALA